MLRNAQEFSGWQFMTPSSQLPRPGGCFQTIERHVDERLENETEATLNDRIKADIVVMCQERGKCRSPTSLERLLLREFY